MGSATPPPTKINEIMERVEIALIELEYAIADFAQFRIDDPHIINPFTLVALREKMRAVEEIFRTVPPDILPKSIGAKL